MPYPKKRLLEALEVIRQDIESQNAAQTERLAKTQYRERHNLRTQNVVQSLPVQVWRYDDSSDDEFNPSQKKRKDSKGGKRKRNVAVASGAEYDLPKRKPRVSKKELDGPVEQGLYAAFLTLKVHTATGKELLRKTLHERDNAKIDTDVGFAEPSQWRINGGCLHQAEESAEQQNMCFHTAQAESSPNEQPEDLLSQRRLRSGKTVQNVLPQKRKAKADDTDEEPIKCPKLTDRTQDLLYKVDEEQEEENSLDQLCATPDHATTALATLNIGHNPDNTITITSSDEETTSNNTTPTKYSATSSRSSQLTTPPRSSRSPIRNNTTLPVMRPGLVRLTTSFSHTINFKSAHQCTFDSDYRHPIFGHGKITADYIVDDTPGKLIETGNGHRAKDIPPDSMCVSCALGYLQIIRCPGHTFVAQHNEQPPHKIFEAHVKDLFTTLKPGHPQRNNDKPLLETCRLCPTPATWRCCEPQLKDKILRPCRLPAESYNDARLRLAASTTPNARAGPKMAIQPPIVGCGLKLCTLCRKLVQDECKGRMDENRAVILDNLQSRSLGARADAEFLFRDGLVAQAYNVGGGSR